MKSRYFAPALSRILLLRRSFVGARSRSTLLILAFFAAQSIGSTVLAHDAAAESAWQKSFSADAVASYLREGDKSVLVAAAGEKSSDLTDATAALVASLRAHKPAVMVMTGEALGNIAALDDEAIAKKAAHLPVGLVAVVRVFPGDPPAAVVSFLDKTGKAVTALSVTRGTPLALGDKAKGTAGAGVTTAAADAIARIHDEKRGDKGAEKGGATGQGGDENADAAARSEEYAANYVGFQDWIGVNQYGQVVSTFSTMYLGSMHKPLGLDAFYDHIGRKDLGDSARTRGRVRGSLFLGGTLLMIGGLIYLKDISAGTDCYNIASEKVAALCTADGDAKTHHALMGMAIVSGAGVVALFAGLFVSANPLSAEETYAMAGDFNRKYREKLGLIPHTRHWWRGPDPSWFASVSAPNADIGGLSIGLRF